MIERCEQDTKWGKDRVLSANLWNTVLSEEVGEVARAILEHDNENLKTELIQVAAVCVAMYEALEHGRLLE